MRFSHRRGSRGIAPRRGFTLAETMVVLVVAAVVITIAIPRVDMTRFKADAVAQSIRSQLQYASRQSITRQHDVIVSFDTVTQQVITTLDANNNGVADPGERVTYRGLDTGIRFESPSVNGIGGQAIRAPITGTSLSSMKGMPTLVFHRDGSVSSGAEIYVSIAAHGPSMYRAFAVTQSTGRVDWYRLNTSTNAWVAAGL
jgi:prepilin-type N-terminal cleavage/methylation domain-containing protein